MKIYKTRALLGLIVILGTIQLSACGLDLGPNVDFDLGIEEGENCSNAPEPWTVCAPGLACSSVTGNCETIGTPGTASKGDTCSATTDCSFGLACAFNGTCLEQGSPGTFGIGEQCEAPDDCQALLACENNVCTGVQIPYWTGAECVPPPAEGKESPKIYFEIPGYDKDNPKRAPKEFYRLPFPNNIRLKNGRIDLSGHVDPGVVIEELGNPVRDYFDVVEADLDGFGTQSAIFLRMNYYPANDSLAINETVFLLDIDPASSEYGKTQSMSYRASSAQGRYICKNWIAISPRTGSPLKPNTTYVAILTTGIKSKSGESFKPDSDFALMLKDSAPADAVAKAAWTAYEPLREFLASEQPDTSLTVKDIAAAAVFTTHDPTTRVKKMREAVRKEESPTAEVAKTDDSDSLFTIETGTLSIPMYQKGTLPFAKIEDGGAIEFQSNGLPKVQKTQDVKYALTVPNTEAPEGGFPIFIYAHGTDGSEMSFVNEEIAARLAVMGAAVIGLEQVQHGDRRELNASQLEDDMYSPENLFYNFANPRAARDNNLQSAADLFQTVRFIEKRASEEGIFNPERIYFMGHSQGTQGSFIGATYEPAIKGFVLSGAGGCLMDTLIGKKKPTDISVGMKVILMDADVPRHHPVLNLIQTVFDSVDPVNFADAVYMKDLTELDISPRSAFISSGMNDTYTPDTTHMALARAMNAPQWVVSGEPLEGLGSVEELPYSHTYGKRITSVIVRYEPAEGEDGHFVIFDNEDAVLQSDYFIETMLDEDVPYPILESAEVLRQ